MDKLVTRARALFLVCVGVLCTYGIISACGGSCDCECKYTSHTFFAVRPQFQSASPERVTLFRDRINAREDGHGGAVQAVIFGGESGDTDKVAKFFTPFCKNKLLVSNELSDSPDILPQYFDIRLERFKSTISLCMKQQVIGFGLAYKQGFWHHHDDQWLWFEISLPVERVKNDVCFREVVDPVSSEPTLTDTPNNMTDAFRQTAWCYGKIDCRACHEKTKLADVEIKLGYEWLKSDCCFLESYLGFLAPAGNEPCARYMFEPIVGHNGHAAISIGGSGSFEFWRAEKTGQVLTFAFDSDARYIFERCERRSFDVKYRPWSRYMYVYASKEQAQQAVTADDENLFTPGINVFTQRMHVKPRLAANCTEALILNYKKMQAEVGYNLFARQAECVRLACKWQDGVAFKAVAGKPGQTTKLQSINYYPVAEHPCTIDQYDNCTLKLEDLDLESAAHPAVFAHTFYGSIGCRWDERTYPLFVGIGASYEWSDDYSGLNRWNAWLKGGVSF